MTRVVTISDYGLVNRKRRIHLPPRKCGEKDRLRPAAADGSAKGKEGTCVYPEGSQVERDGHPSEIISTARWGPLPGARPNVG